MWGRADWSYWKYNLSTEDMLYMKDPEAFISWRYEITSAGTSNIMKGMTRVNVEGWHQVPVRIIKVEKAIRVKFIYVK